MISPLLYEISRSDEHLVFILLFKGERYIGSDLDYFLRLS